jgi:hypothetical protein
MFGLREESRRHAFRPDIVGATKPIALSTRDKKIPAA